MLFKLLCIVLFVKVFLMSFCNYFFSFLILGGKFFFSKFFVFVLTIFGIYSVLNNCCWLNERRVLCKIKNKYKNIENKICILFSFYFFFESFNLRKEFCVV